MSEETISPLRILSTQQIGKKILVLEGWIENGIPWRLHDASGEVMHDHNDEKLLDYFPKTIRDFARWDGSQNCAATREKIGELSTSSRTTLGPRGHHVKQRELIEQILKQLPSKATEQLTEQNKSLKIERLESKLAFLQKLVVQQETDVLALTRKSTVAAARYRDERATRISNKKQWLAERASLEKRLSELTKQLSKLTRLEVK